MFDYLITSLITANEWGEKELQLRQVADSQYKLNSEPLLCSEVAHLHSPG